ncbi:MAG: hemolysin family protein [Spirochaetota bacterium]
METDTEAGSHAPSFFSFLKKKPRKKGDIDLLHYVNGDIEESKKQMIRGIMELSKLCAREIMIPRVDITALSIDTPLKQVISVTNQEGHSRIPVYDGTIDQIQGILYVKELLAFVLDRRRKFELKRYLHKPLFIPETMPLDELLVEFKKKRQHLAIVVDEYGGVAGLVTMENILEEIVGDIHDEFDEHEKPECIPLNGHTYDVDSRMSITDLNEQIGTDLPDDEFDSVGGFVFDLFGKIPVKNEIIEYRNYAFKIKEIEGTRINRIILMTARS